MAGCKSLHPFGETSVIKTAAPIAKGVAMRADKIVTIKEPKIIGRAPNCFPEGFQVCPKREIKDIHSIDKKVDKPFGLQNQNHGHNDDNQRKASEGVKPLPNFSRREFFEGESNFLDNSSSIHY